MDVAWLETEPLWNDGKPRDRRRAQRDAPMCVQHATIAAEVLQQIAFVVDGHKMCSKKYGKEICEFIYCSQIKSYIIPCS
jgi:hypothetical protein